MKKIFLFILLFICLKGFSQGYPSKQTLGSPTSKLEVLGGVHAVKGLINGRYADTTAANLGYIDSYHGSQIFTTTDKILWWRDSVLNKWVNLSAGGSATDTSNKWVNNITKNAGGDSIIYYINTTRYAVSDPSSIYTASQGLTLTGSNFTLGGTVSSNRVLTVGSNWITLDGTTRSLILNADGWATSNPAGGGGSMYIQPGAGSAFPGITYLKGAVGSGTTLVATGVHWVGTAGGNKHHFISDMRDSIQYVAIESAGTHMAAFGTLWNGHHTDLGAKGKISIASTGFLDHAGNKGYLDNYKSTYLRDSLMYQFRSVVTDSAGGDLLWRSRTAPFEVKQISIPALAALIGGVGGGENFDATLVIGNALAANRTIAANTFQLGVTGTTGTFYSSFTTGGNTSVLTTNAGLVQLNTNNNVVKTDDASVLLTADDGTNISSIQLFGTENVITTETGEGLKYARNYGSSELVNLSLVHKRYVDSLAALGGSGAAWGSITGTLSSQTDLQTALNLKSPLASPTFTGTVTIPTPFTLGAVSVLPTGTELNYVDGVTSAIQTQLDTKAPLTSPTFTGTPAAPTAAAATNTTQIATTAHVFAERSNTFTFTNKTLTSPQINGAKLETSSIVGYVWTATNTAGAGSWQAASGADSLGFYVEAPIYKPNDSTVGLDSTKIKIWPGSIIAGATVASGGATIAMGSNDFNIDGDNTNLLSFTDLDELYISAATLTLPDIPPSHGASDSMLVINPSGQVGFRPIPSGGGSGTVTSVGFTGGLISVATATTTPAFTVAGTSGGIPYFSSASTWASSAALAANALVIGGGAGTAPSTTTTGTGVLTFLGTPSSANLAAAITDETGSGLSVFATSPTLTTPSITTAAGTALTVGGALTPSASANGFITNLGGGITEAGSGTHAILAGVAVLAPVVTGAGGAVTSAASLYISGATNASGANNASLWVAAGNLRLGQAGTATGTMTLEGSTSGIATITVAAAAGTPTLTLPTTSGTLATTAGTGLPGEWIIAASDETTAITTGTGKVTFRVPFAATVTAVRASVNTVSSSGIPTFDINEAGTTILSTKLTIDASEFTSVTAAAAAVISDTALADDAEITIDFDVAGTGAKGVKIIIYYTRN